MKVIETHSLSKYYNVDNRQLTILTDINLTIDAGQFVVIKGESGSGKSTLLSLLSGLDHPSHGRIILDRNDITDYSEDQLAPIRNQTIGYVFQSFHLAPSLTAIENIKFPAELLQGNRGNHAETLAQKLLQQVGLTDRADNYPHQLSGGEKQRVAIARALINRPKIIFADEPTGNLDSINSEIVLDILLSLQQQFQTTLVLVTHDNVIAARADKLITIVDGHLI